MNNAQHSLIKEYVKIYRKLGFNVIPVKYGTSDKFFFRWGEYQEKKYEGEFPEKCNLAVVLGPVSENLLCIDFDDIYAYYDFRNKILNSKLKDIFSNTMKVKSPKGVHVYFRFKSHQEGLTVLNVAMEKSKKAGKKVEVEFLEDVGEFISPKGKVYGPFKKGQREWLPPSIVELLEKSGVVRIIGVTGLKGETFSIRYKGGLGMLPPSVKEGKRYMFCYQDLTVMGDPEVYLKYFPPQVISTSDFYLILECLGVDIKDVLPKHLSLGLDQNVVIPQDIIDLPNEFWIELYKVFLSVYREEHRHNTIFYGFSYLARRRLDIFKCYTLFKNLVISKQDKELHQRIRAFLRPFGRAGYPESLLRKVGEQILNDFGQNYKSDVEWGIEKGLKDAQEGKQNLLCGYNKLSKELGEDFAKKVKELIDNYKQKTNI